MVLLVGAGPMAMDHSRVLEALGVNYVVVGRGQDSALKFENETGHPVISGGISGYVNSGNKLPETAIVSVGIEQLADTTSLLIEKGVKRILVEKPAGLTLVEITNLVDLKNEMGVDVCVAYNRRFYSSVLAAQKIIESDGGVENFMFEVTEWGHTIEPLKKAAGVKENWFLGNTSHIVDLAFFLGGLPSNINCFSSGETSWHRSSAIFAGAGETENGALFSYTGNWNAPGRWNLELVTRNHRLIFRPLEKLQIQKVGSIQIEECSIEDDLDKEFKPGLFKQIESFLNGRKGHLCELEEHLKRCKYYIQMANYDS